MPYVKVGKENSGDIQLHYQDYGTGKPAVLIHGYPQNASAWEKQIPALLDAGFRVVAYDRRGFGSSSQPNDGYDYDTFATDLNQLINTLNLNEVTLIGHSMGSGEIVRYLSKYGSMKIERAVFISPLQPFMMKTEDNPEGLDKGLFDDFQKSADEDRFAFLKSFFQNFYSKGLVGHSGVSDQAIQHNINVGARASAKATIDCIATWITDFRADLPHITIPSLIIQGTGDKVLPYEITGERLHKMLKNNQLVALEGAPHGLLWTHAPEVNRALTDFLSDKSSVREVA